MDITKDNSETENESRITGYEHLKGTRNSVGQRNTRTIQTTRPGTADPEVPIPPDGGYGWVVTAASLFSCFLIDGVNFSFGIFFLEFLDEFGQSKEKTSWAGSVTSGIYLGIGPVVGALANRFGFRKIAIIGTFISSGSLILSTFSPNIYVLIVTYGFLTGIGFGMSYLPAIVIVGFYFEKRRALATGIAVCGSGIGGFVFAPLSEKLIEMYGWKGATWIIAGLSLNGIACGLIYKPLKVKKKRSASKNIAMVEDVRYFKKIHSSRVHPEPTVIIRDVLYNEELHQRSVKSASDVQKCPTSYVMTQPSVSTKDDKACSNCCCKNQKNRSSSKESTSKPIIDFSLLKNPCFCIYCISCFLVAIGVFIPLFYLPDVAVGYGFNRSQAAFLLSIFGITNTVTRVLCGWITDQSWADCLMINNCALVIGGVATILVPFFRWYWLLCVYSFVLGAFFAVYISLISIILVELIGLDKLTSSFGLLLLSQGIAAFVGPPVAGALFDATGDYNSSFYMAGSLIALAGVICFPVRKLATHQKKSSLDLQEQTHNKTQNNSDVENVNITGWRSKDDILYK